MYFKRLELQGFKSFAEPTVVEFDSGITCVVGPNGSGKSNICDAIRWALGEQSSKTLRGDKMEDVIFNGSGSHKARGMTEVTLVIDNSDSSLDIDYNEVAITRRMYRSGESEYLINNNRCRMKDVRELIMDTGIGVEGYSLIGQGKINDIISDKTESIREILEETAGIVMYRSKKAESERRLASASANLERVGDIIGEIESRIGGLKEDSEKATEFLTLRDRHKELEINITLKNIDQIELKSEYLKDELAEVGIKLEEDKQKRSALAIRIEEASAKRGELDGLIGDSRARQLDLLEEINRLESDSKIKGERLASLEKDSERLVEEVQELKLKIETETNNSRELFESKSKIDEENDKLRAGLEEKTEAHIKAIEELNNKGEEIDEKKNRIINLQGEINSAKSRKESMEEMLATLAERKEDILREKAGTDEEGRDKQNELAKAKEDAKALEAELTAIKEEESELRAEYNEAHSEELKLSGKASELKISAGRLSARKAAIEEMEANYEGYNNAVKFVMKNGLGGIRGVVAELIDVPEGFETAIETALGATMQNIICDTDASAKNAIGKLKQNKAGRLTFLPIDSVKFAGTGRDENLKSLRGFKGFGVDCVRCAGEYDEIMQYLLGKTIVMDNMDSAVAASKVGRGYRFVTLEGEIINAGGAITGGRYKNSSANILERKSEINSLGEELAELQQEQEDATARADSLKKQMGKILSRIDEADREYREKERVFFSKENEIKILDTGLSEQENANMRRESELANIKDKSDDAREELARLDALVEEAVSAKAKAETETEEAQKEFDRIKSDMDRIGEEITSARITLGGCDSEKSKIDALVERVNETIEGYRADVMRKETELADAQSEVELLKGGGEITTGDKRQEKELLDAYLAELEEERDAVVASLTEDTALKEQMDEAASSLQNSKYEMDVKQARYETQLDNAKSKLWEEFDISFAKALEYKSEDFVMSHATKENREIKNRIKELGEVNVGAIEEYKAVSERYEFLTSQRADIVTSMEELKKIISDMDKVIHGKFKESFDAVVENFEQVYRDLHNGGGHATIMLADESDPFESEIEIKAEPPGKQLKNINLLSGGEKTMTAIALMFAVLKTKPTPCCILDEVEAALDETNLGIFGRYLRNFEDVQFTLITHQEETMQHADVMYGITMAQGDGVSQVYSIKVEEA